MGDGWPPPMEMERKGVLYYLAHFNHRRAWYSSQPPREIVGEIGGDSDNDGGEDATPFDRPESSPGPVPLFSGR